MPDNYLYYGDNLDILRRYIKDESVDLVYLDPPFNSNASYNVLFAEKGGGQSAAQIKAFEDTWHWDQSAARTYHDVVLAGGQVSQAMQAFRTLLGENDMLAYLTMMAPRLTELRRILKPTGSIYLHCDPTASHYLKILLDAIFGPQNFRNSITWKRADVHNNARRQFGAVSDHILFYVRSKDANFNIQYAAFQEQTLRDWYQYLQFPDGTVRRMTKEERKTQRIPTGARRFNTDNLRNPSNRPNLQYEYKGYKPHPNGWAVSYEKMQELDAADMLFFPASPDGRIMRKRYLDEAPGAVVGDVWVDISQLRGSQAEALGYPTQKPEALLERIVQASSNPGDVVLDPFCGCGTAISVAHRLNRRWIGIDLTQIAVSLMKSRLQDTFGADVAKTYTVIGEPVAYSEAVALAAQDKYQFQYWALGLVKARPLPQDEKKGADQGIDGRLYFIDDGTSDVKQVILSVKGGHTDVTHVRDLVGVLDREKAQIGVLITLQEPTGPMRTEAASAGFYNSPFDGPHRRVQILTIKELLEGKRIDMPPPGQVNVTFKRAPRAKAGVTATAPSIWGTADDSDDVDADEE